ncbi:flavodoxin domain-containing protein [Stenotrophomonas sp. HITSZ_GD]|uniref:sulfite reductase subunit alpha n=1 Tax=Stenotrophomonas sp. HITSZ_GD TaxID=3037248 RepID=UPI00240D5404|nr:flavodoxin domain-containing protein [Stenotrophomonas sp. HITSZ_GD]MDG2525524.1 flavodoxin domain-containing protein [Stenotrophomonas sp. HITSZ_GD]
MNPPWAWRAWLGNAAVLALLAVAGYCLQRLHAGAAWWPGTALRWQWQAAAGSVLAYAALCGAVAWRARPSRPAPGGGAPLIVAWASQTGFAAELAERSAQALRASSVPAQAMPLQALDAETLRTAERVLFVVSTTGEGDPPDHALAFLRRTAPRIQALPKLRYGMLALGDRSYDDFCAFGRQLDEWLSRHGAHTLFDRVEVDNADPGTLRHWQYLLGQLGDGTAQADWERPQYQPWRLDARERTNPGCDAGAVFRLSLQPAQGERPTWQAGDIAEIGPRHASVAVSRFLAAHHLDGDRLVHGEPLRDWIARSQWQDITDGPLERWVDALQPLPHREYSIASIPAEHRLDLLVRRQLGPDGRPGLGSGWLCEHAAVGGTIALRLRTNPGFHPPADARPLILIGNGTGIAGLRAHLAARIEAGATRNWLLFGERHAAHDNHFAHDLQRWQETGGIERLDTVYSRDGGRHRYVQDALADAAEALRAWIGAGASLYVCGSLRGMAPAVDAVLEQVLGADVREALLLAGRYRRDVY